MHSAHPERAQLRRYWALAGWEMLELVLGTIPTEWNHTNSRTNYLLAINTQKY